MKQIRYAYLPKQFADPSEILERLKEVVAAGDYTLGRAVAEFERKFAALVDVKHAIGVNSGTDALKLSLKVLGVGPGDEVITATNTFVSTVGAIAEVGATPVVVDVDDSFCIDVSRMEAAITPRTKVLMPVHLTGNMADMPAIMKVADKHGLKVVEDACQAILADLDGRKAGTWGAVSGFSLHPQKNLNVWGDGGVVVTDDDQLAEGLRTLRNNGIRDRDVVEMLGYNSRLDSIQAVVGSWLIDQCDEITARRNANARFYDKMLGQIPQIRIPPRRPNVRHVYHIYQLFAETRDDLLSHCIDHGVEAKIHYPIPLHRQKGLAYMGCNPADFPVAERHAREMMTLPVDQHMTHAEQEYVVDVIRDFYRGQ